MPGRSPSPSAPQREEVIDTGAVRLPAVVGAPQQAIGAVIFAHGSGSSRFSPRNAQVAARLRDAGLATIILDLLTEVESQNRRNVFNIPLLASRLTAAAHWVRHQPDLRDLPVGLFGASTGAAAALACAADDPQIRAVVSRGGRPDLAAAALKRITAPTLLIVGGRDEPVLDLNRQAQRDLAGDSQLEVIPRATHLFEEPGALEEVADLAAAWFTRHLAGPQSGPEASAQSGDAEWGGFPTRRRRPPETHPAPTSPPHPLLGFRDRAEAGDMLATALADYRGSDCVVLGLPRGGVEVGARIARRLDCDLDVLLVRKLPAPPQPELALGAVAGGGGAEPVRVLDTRRIRALGLTDLDIERIAAEQFEEVRRREALYRGARAAAEVRGRTAIVVDDGVATGSTAEAALRAVRARDPAQLIFATPVGAPEAIDALAEHCDRIVCLLQPAGFVAVGAYYAHFTQTTDDHVMQLLQAGSRS